jgi:hypothetical protein
MNDPAHPCGQNRIMGGNNKRPPTRNGQQCVGDIACGFGVEMSGRLVCEDDVNMWGCGSTGNRQPQGLASGQTRPAFADQRYAALGRDPP